MAKIWRVYSGADGQSHISEERLPMKPFLVTGQGHITRVIGREPRFYAIVPLG